jgi:hypothetical protein
MNFMDFTRPWSRVIANGAKDKDYWAVDGHSGNWAETTPRWLEAREKGVHLQGYGSGFGDE